MPRPGYSSGGAVLEGRLGWQLFLSVKYLRCIALCGVLAMSVFEQVSVVREANIYFDGKVSSREVRFADGTKKTLGIMLPGEYTFSTGAAEIMEILAGEMMVLLPGGDTVAELFEGADIQRASAFRV
jgi:hypothetical protein